MVNSSTRAAPGAIPAIEWRRGGRDDNLSPWRRDQYYATQPGWRWRFIHRYFDGASAGIWRGNEQLRCSVIIDIRPFLP